MYPSGLACPKTLLGQASKANSTATVTNDAMIELHRNGDSNQNEDGGMERKSVDWWNMEDF